jgi:hypothetical protein
MDETTRPAPTLSTVAAATASAVRNDNWDRAIARTIMPCATCPMAAEETFSVYAKSTCWQTWSEAAPAGTALDLHHVSSPNWREPFAL